MSGGSVGDSDGGAGVKVDVGVEKTACVGWQAVSEKSNNKMSRYFFIVFFKTSIILQNNQRKVIVTNILQHGGIEKGEKIGGILPPIV